jgi:hypothetical protein
MWTSDRKRCTESLNPIQSPRTQEHSPAALDLVKRHGERHQNLEGLQHDLRTTAKPQSLTNRHKRTKILELELGVLEEPSHTRKKFRINHSALGRNTMRGHVSGYDC